MTISTNRIGNLNWPILDTIFTEWALFLDFDGTLVELADHPDRVIIDPNLGALLKDLHGAFHGACAIISGRPLHSLDRYLKTIRLPGAGGHGAEYRLTSQGAITSRAPAFPSDLQTIIELSVRDLQEVLMEKKECSVAIHFRNAAHLGITLHKRLAACIAHYPAYHMISGVMVLEIIPNTCGKAKALERLCAASPFKHRKPIMIGDDASDHSAMAFAIERGGIGLKVSGDYFSPQLSHFSGPTDVRSWLASLIGTVGTRKNLID
jgi:trehalose 6-phosphate phosphatase